MTWGVTGMHPTRSRGPWVAAVCPGEAHGAWHKPNRALRGVRAGRRDLKGNIPCEEFEMLWHFKFDIHGYV